MQRRGMSKSVCWILFASASVAGCGDLVSEEGLSDERTRQQEIVIGNFDVRHAGHLWHEADLELDPAGNRNDLDEALRNYRALQVTNSSVRIDVAKRTKAALDKCEDVYYSKGSGNLTSSSRITTSWHIAGTGLDEKPTATFGSFALGVVNEESVVLSRGGLWYDGSSPLEVMSDSIPENPLLSNRLFSLGLDKWARSSNIQRVGVRDKLRFWKDYVADNVGMEQNILTPNAEGVLTGPDIMVLRPSSTSQAEFADTVNSKWNENGAPEYLPSGPFVPAAPGPFFTTLVPNGYADNGKEVCKPSTKDRYYSSMHLEYDYWSSTHFAPLVSHGYRDNRIIGNKDPKSYCVNAFEKVKVKFDPALRATADIAGGSSGGALLGQTCRYHVEEGFEGWEHNEPLPFMLVNKGVTQGAPHIDASSMPTPWGRAGYAEYKTKDAPDEANDAPDEANDAPDQEEPKRGISDLYAEYKTKDAPDHEQRERGINDFDTAPAKPANLFAAHTAHTTRWSKRDLDYSTGDPYAAGDPFGPEPNLPATDECPGEIVDKRCVFRVSESVSTGEGAYPASGTTPPELFSGPVASNGQSTGGTEELRERVGGFEQNAEKKGLSVVWCQNFGGSSTSIDFDGTPVRHVPASVTRKVNMMQGFMGSSNVQITEETYDRARVDALTPVCVPWSSATWLDNWAWASIQVNEITRVKQTATWWMEDLFSGRGAVSLSRMLALVAELRTVPVTDKTGKQLTNKRERYQVRPPSMKSCPPNYYLHGVNYLATPDNDGEKEVIGFESLICRAHARAKRGIGSKLPVELEVSLNDSTLGDDYVVSLPYEVSYENPMFKFFELYKGYASTLLDQSSAFKAFSLDQHIGYPRTDGLVEEEQYVRGSTKCASDSEVAIAMMMRRNSDNNINYFKLLCTQAPK